MRKIIPVPFDVFQMDMIHEAKALKIMGNDFANCTHIRIPVPILSLVRRNVLVESYEVGTFSSCVPL
jgi:predicted unusual protein kinase regulating ubiquinone biosynthesis (AarF/ABC1/UbiB family)